MKLAKEYKLGLLTVFVLVSSFFVINFLRGRDVFNREIELVGYFDDLETLVASAPVQIRGYAAGHVSKVEYCPQTDNFKVVCAVTKELNIPTDSRMLIYSTSIMGGKGIRIEPGSSAQSAQSGDVLTTGSQADLLSMLSDSAAPLLEKLGTAVDSLTLVLSNVNQVLCDQNKNSIASSLRHLNSTLASFNRLAASLGGKSEQINAIVDNLSELSAKLAPLADSAQGTVDNLKDVSAQLKDAGLGETVQDLGAAVKTVDNTVKDIEQPLENLLSDLDELVKKIQENPKKYLKISVF